MTIQSPQGAFNMRRGHISWLLLLAGWALAGLLPAGAVAATSPQATAGPDIATPLRPYVARYKTTTRGMELSLTRKLKSGPSDTYTLTNGGKIMVVGFHEVSVFRVAGTQVIPKSYVYQGTGLINRRREVHFTPGSDTIRSLYKEQWYDLPKTERTLDRMSQLEQVRLLLLNDPVPAKDFSIQVADGKRVKDYQLVYVGEELIQTPLGSVPTLHFKRLHDNAERKSDIWLAPDWDYLMVKTVHIDDGSAVEVLLSSASIEGMPVPTQ